MITWQEHCDSRPKAYDLTPHAAFSRGPPPDPLEAPKEPTARVTSGACESTDHRGRRGCPLCRYKAAGTARQRGQIYARELSPRIGKGENVFGRFPVEAVNTLGTVANAVVSQRLLELVVSSQPELTGITTDFSDSVAAKGDSVKTRTIGIPTFSDFNSTESNAGNSRSSAPLFTLSG